MVSDCAGGTLGERAGGWTHRDGCGCGRASASLPMLKAAALIWHRGAAGHDASIEHGLSRWSGWKVCILLYSFTHAFEYWKLQDNNSCHFSIRPIEPIFVSIEASCSVTTLCQIKGGSLQRGQPGGSPSFRAHISPHSAKVGQPVPAACQLHLTPPCLHFPAGKKTAIQGAFQV
eukprot:615072-Pelagomonas_calceolata.AAC.4